MIAGLIFIGKASLAIMVFSLFYRVVFSSDKFFVRNRFFLAGGVVLSFIFPWITIPVWETDSSPLIIRYLDSGNAVVSQAAASETIAFSWVTGIFLIYVAGVVAGLIKMSIAYFQVYSIIKHALHTSLGKTRIVATKRHLSPFSFLRWIVIPQHMKDHPSYDKMVQHEMVHSRQYHSVDLFLAELLITLQWFNPFAWFLRKDISENLEYLADEEMLRKGINARDYQYSLLNLSTGGLTPAVANYFNSNLLKKRITMMNSRRYPRRYRLKNLLIPVCLVCTLLISVSFKKQVHTMDFSQDPVVTGSLIPESSSPVLAAESVETPGISGNAAEVEEAFLGYILNQVRYPMEAISMNVEGVVEMPVKFLANGVQFPKENVTAPRMKQVVVVAYPNEETAKHPTGENNAISFSSLQNEVTRVLNSYKKVPKELAGKTYVVSVKFIIERPKADVMPGTDGKVKFRNASNSSPTFILNNQKIISKEEMEKITPESIQSVEVHKGEKYVHPTLGEIEGDVILIRTK